MSRFYMLWNSSSTDETGSKFSVAIFNCLKRDVGKEKKKEIYYCSIVINTFLENDFLGGKSCKIHFWFFCVCDTIFFLNFQYQNKTGKKLMVKK